MSFLVFTDITNDFILESGSFDTKNEAQDLCNILNNSNNSEHLNYVIVESKTLTEPSPDVSLKVLQHIYFLMIMI